jgi:predicted transcriptional regulator of viral defense system
MFVVNKTKPMKPLNKMKTSKQTSVLDYLSKVDEAHKKDIYANVNFGYYLNWEKHLGALLGRMVKSGMIERAGRGVYKIRHLPKADYDKHDIDPNQLTLL